MLPEKWAPPCGKHCTKKYASVLQIPWRVFCKKGCDADGEDWEECVEECTEICYKDPVLKDRQWSAYIDRSPGAESYSLECFRACVSGCGHRFEVASETVDTVQPSRPPTTLPPIVSKWVPPQTPPSSEVEPAVDIPKENDVPSTSA